MTHHRIDYPGGGAITMANLINFCFTIIATVSGVTAVGWMVYRFLAVFQEAAGGSANPVNQYSPPRARTRTTFAAAYPESNHNSAEMNEAKTFTSPATNVMRFPVSSGKNSANSRTRQVDAAYLSMQHAAGRNSTPAPIRFGEEPCHCPYIRALQQDAQTSGGKRMVG